MMGGCEMLLAAGLIHHMRFFGCISDGAPDRTMNLILPSQRLGIILGFRLNFSKEQLDRDDI
jgi:hypothetical protein